MLPKPTIQKLFRDCFPEEYLQKHGIVAVESAKRKEWLEHLLSRISQLARVQGKIWLYDSTTSRYVLGFVVNGVSSVKNPDDYFQLHFHTRDDLEGLWIYDAKRRRRGTKILPVGVASPEQIEVFINAVKTRQEREDLREKRNQKVANLKQTGLKSRLREIGERHGCSFAIAQTKRDVNLSIRMGEKKTGFHFAFPKGKLDAVIDQVPELIETLEKLQSLGITFRTNNKKWAHRQGEWIIPDQTNHQE